MTIANLSLNMNLKALLSMKILVSSFKKNPASLKNNIDKHNTQCKFYIEIVTPVLVKNIDVNFIAVSEAVIVVP